MNQRAVLFHCPYCGDENLWPHEGDGLDGSAPRGGWECRSCLRAFTVTMIAQLRPPPSARPGAEDGAHR